MKLLALLAVALAPLLAAAAPFHKRQAATTTTIVQTTMTSAPATTTTTTTTSATPTQTVAPFPANVTQLSAWQALASNPDLTNFTSLIKTYSPGLLAALNNTTPANSTVTTSPTATVQQATTTGTPSPPPPAATQWTVFAPTNQGMQPLLNSSFFRFVEALANARINNGSQPGNDTLFTPVLQRFLNYHIVPGVFLSTDFPPPGQNASLLTEAGLNVTVQVAPTRPQLVPNIPSVTLSMAQATTSTTMTASPPTPTDLYWVSDAQVLVADVVVANGVIHVVDKPLSPLGAGENAAPITIPTTMTLTALPTAFPTTLPSVTATLPVPTGIATLVPPPSPSPSP